MPWGSGGKVGHSLWQEKGMILNALRALERPRLTRSPTHHSGTMSERGRVLVEEVEEAQQGADSCFITAWCVWALLPTPQH